jgi:hypothetical protein
MFQHSSDFRSVLAGEHLYDFTPLQAEVVRQLVEAARNGTPAVGYRTLLDGAGSVGEVLRSLFVIRGKLNPAWGTLIVPGPRKGSRQIAQEFLADIRPV